ICHEPLHGDARMGHEGQDEQASRDEERVGGAQDGGAGRRHAGVRADRADGAAVRAHQHDRHVEQAAHRTSSAPPLMLTSASLTATVCAPRLSVMPVASSVTELPFESSIVTLAASSSSRILCCLVAMTLTPAAASEGT